MKGALLYRSCKQPTAENIRREYGAVQVFDPRERAPALRNKPKPLQSRDGAYGSTTREAGSLRYLSFDAVLWVVNRGIAAAALAPCGAGRWEAQGRIPQA